MAAGKRTSAARKTAGIKGKITAKQRVARVKNIAVARKHKRSKLTGKKPSGGGGLPVNLLLLCILAIAIFFFLATFCFAVILFPLIPAVLLAAEDRFPAAIVIPPISRISVCLLPNLI